MRRVLSIDGGGIRGIIPALVLAKLEQEIGKPCCQLFDLMCGTSTGGILSMGLSINVPGTSAPYSAKQLVKIYRERGSDIFPRSRWKGVTSIGGLSDEKYPSDGIESVLLEYFRSEPLESAQTKVMVTSYDIEAREPFFLKSWNSNTEQVPMRLAARATSAAPTYFEPALVKVNNKRRALVDGGVFINNPAVSAYVEAKKLFPDDDIKLLSLGTGELVRAIPFNQAKDWGKVGWALPVMSCMFDGVSDAADHQLKVLLGEDYLRLQTILTDADDDMDNVSKSNISALSRLAEQLIDQQVSTLLEFLD